MWIIYSLLTAFSLATSDALTKRALASRDEYVMAWARLVCALPVLLISLMFVEIPALDPVFWKATLCALPLEITAIILYTKALKISPISLTMPFLALTPLFLILTSALIAGERVTAAGAAGIVLMAVGGYTLNIHKIRYTVFEPVKAVFREKGSVMMIIVAFIYSITSSLGKVAIEHSSPIFFGAFYFVLVTVFFTPVALLKGKYGFLLSRSELPVLLSAGVTFSAMIVFHMLAMSLVNVAYMISVKRTSLLFSVLYGHVLFREARIREKMTGAFIMLMGFVVIVMSG